MFLFGILIAFVIAFSVGIDARHRYTDQVTPVLWFFAVWAVLIVSLPAYLIARPPRLDKTR